MKRASASERLAEIRSIIERAEGYQHFDDRLDLQLADARRIYRLTTPPRKKASPVKRGGRKKR